MRRRARASLCRRSTSTRLRRISLVRSSFCLLSGPARGPRAETVCWPTRSRVCAAAREVPRTMSRRPFAMLRFVTPSPRSTRKSLLGSTRSFRTRRKSSSLAMCGESRSSAVTAMARTRATSPSGLRASMRISVSVTPSLRSLSSSSWVGFQTSTSRPSSPRTATFTCTRRSARALIPKRTSTSATSRALLCGLAV